MQEAERLTTEQREMEAALSGLAPQSPQRDPSALMFELGRRAERRRCRRWQAGVGGLGLLLAVSLGVNVLSVGTRSPEAGMMAVQHTAPQPTVEREREAIASTPPADPSVDAEHARPEVANAWSWLGHTESRPPSTDTPIAPRQSVGHLSRLVQEHGIDALPEPALRFTVDPADRNTL
ncbi:hypothetical protein ACERK3_03795 [Phycisphaerales bacterium AB-hyl4]|uniref:Uncharacterized protein n=1 Tax=Natronomicrosphaera hydrolytica TaxID=3242702 RepID=A0ABV4U531_9BACT